VNKRTQRIRCLQLFVSIRIHQNSAEFLLDVSQSRAPSRSVIEHMALLQQQLLQVVADVPAPDLLGLSRVRQNVAFVQCSAFGARVAADDDEARAVQHERGDREVVEHARKERAPLSVEYRGQDEDAENCERHEVEQVAALLGCCGHAPRSRA